MTFQVHKMAEISSGPYQQEYTPLESLIIGMIARAYLDSIGRVGWFKTADFGSRSELVQDGCEFFTDGRFHHYCELLGIPDPDGLLREMRRLEQLT